MFHGLQREHFPPLAVEKEQESQHSQCQFERSQYMTSQEKAWERYQQAVLDERAAVMPDTELERLLRKSGSLK